MSEIKSLGSTSSKRAEQPKYLDQPKPYLKDGLERELWRNVDRKNKAIHAKINDINKRPPAEWHAPAPPLTADHQGTLRAKQQRAVQIENARIEKKLGDIYASKRLTLNGVHREFGPTLDLNEKFSQRTSLYHPVQPPAASPPKGPSKALPPCLAEQVIDAAAAAARSGPSYPPRSARPSGPGGEGGPSYSGYSPSTPPSPHQAMTNYEGLMQQRQHETRMTMGSRPRSAAAAGPRREDVSKNLGLAICAGCGVKSFSGADGPGLFPCQQCRKVFYCSETCAKTDLQSHRMLCKHESKGAPMSLARPADDYWVNNAAMAKARHELHVRAARQVVLSPEQEVEERARVAKVAQAARAKEQRAAEKQRRIEYLADNDMDGPRPCMYMAGKKI